jgi:hypothetical protein
LPPQQASPGLLAYGDAMTGGPQLWDAARTIYAAPLPDFISVRKQQALELKQAGDAETAQQVAAFKKPSAAADLVNRLVRQEPDLIEEIDDLGARLRAAAGEADAGAVRELDRERRDLVGRCVAAARDHARRDGKSATDATLRDVEQTVWAAIIDARAGATVRAGVLVKGLSAGGFSEVEVDGASALDVEAPPQSARPARRRVAKAPKASTASKTQKMSETTRTATKTARRALERELGSAQAQAKKRQDDLERAAHAAEAARAEQTRLEERRDQLKAELADVEHDLRTVRRDVSDRRADLKTAERHRRSAASAVDQALRAVDEA